MHNKTSTCCYNVVSNGTSQLSLFFSSPPSADPPSPSVPQPPSLSSFNEGTSQVVLPLGTNRSSATWGKLDGITGDFTIDWGGSLSLLSLFFSLYWCIFSSKENRLGLVTLLESLEQRYTKSPYLFLCMKQARMTLMLSQPTPPMRQSGARQWSSRASQICERGKHEEMMRMCICREKNGRKGEWKLERYQCTGSVNSVESQSSNQGAAVWSLHFTWIFKMWVKSAGGLFTSYSQIGSRVALLLYTIIYVHTGIEVHIVYHWGEGEYSIRKVKHYSPEVASCWMLSSSWWTLPLLHLTSHPTHLHTQYNVKCKHQQSHALSIAEYGIWRKKWKRKNTHVHVCRWTIVFVHKWSVLYSPSHASTMNSWSGVISTVITSGAAVEGEHGERGKILPHRAC